MPLYHVRISIAGARRDETKIDLTSEQLENQFLCPYREGRPITVNGRVIRVEDLARIRISESDKSATDFYAQLRNDDRNSSVAVIGGPSYEWRAASKAKDVTDKLISGPPGFAKNATGKEDSLDTQVRRVTVPSGPGDKRTVFLVQGRNLKIARAMTDFLRALDLKVIDWEQSVTLTGEPNPYIGDIIAAGLEAADAVVVLATPDDRVKLDPSLAEKLDDPELQEAGQPRQNVIYEAGMAMALAPQRTLIVATPGTKILSDISGRHLSYLDNSATARKRIVGRLQTLGLAVDDSGTEWFDAGHFES